MRLRGGPSLHHEDRVGLLVVDAHGGAAPLPAYSYKEPLRLAEHLVPDGPDEGAVSEDGIDALTAFTAQALDVAEEKGCEEILAFATSAVRDSANADAVLDHVHERTDVRIEVLSGEDEARWTFLAVRRWCGWSAGRLLVLDIGGGSLELAVGRDETPDVAASVPLGAGRLTRDAFTSDPPSRAEVAALTERVRDEIALARSDGCARVWAHDGERDVAPAVCDGLCVERVRVDVRKDAIAAGEDCVAAKHLQVASCSCVRERWLAAKHLRPT